MDTVGISPHSVLWLFYAIILFVPHTGALFMYWPTRYMSTWTLQQTAGERCGQKPTHRVTTETTCTSENHFGQGPSSVQKHVIFRQEDRVTRLLQSNFLRQVDGGRHLKIFVPLCGKTLDMTWLAEQGNRVVGAEMVETPVRTFFEAQGLDFVTEDTDTGPLYKTIDGKIKVYVSDLFSLSREALGLFDVVWDRAAFVALNKADRQRYVSLLKSLMTEGCRYLLCVVDMKKAGGESLKGPPHVTRADDIQALFGNEYAVSFVEGLDCTPDADPVWGIEWFYENLYVIQLRKSI